MRNKQHRARVRALIAFAVVLCWSSVVHDQDITVQTLQKKPWQYWNQQDIQYGFAHFGEVYPSRVIPAGAEASKLESGSPLPYFAAGTPGGLELEQFLTDERVAGSFSSLAC
jgi:hypothetical protein